MENKQVVGIVGGLMLLAGMFAPAITFGLPIAPRLPFPVSISVSYVRYSATVGNNEWLLLGGMGVSALLLSLTKMYLGLLFTGTTALGTIGFTVVDLQQKQHLLFQLLPSSLAGIVARFADVMSAFFIQLDWGSLLLVCGPLLMLMAAALQQPRPPRRSPSPRGSYGIVCRSCNVISAFDKAFCGNCGARLHPELIDLPPATMPQRRLRDLSARDQSPGS